MGVGFIDGAVAAPQALGLRADQHEARLVGVLDGELVPRLPVARHDVDALGLG
jgi:hypothetical protein